MSADVLAIIPCQDGLQQVIRRPGLGAPTVLHLTHKRSSDIGEALLATGADTEADYQELLDAAKAADGAQVLLDAWRPSSSGSPTTGPLRSSGIS